MNKVFGLKSDFTLVREEGSRIVVSYNQTEVDETHCEWIEVYLPKKQNPSILTLDMVKNAILGDIDTDTDAKILCGGYQWTVLHGDDEGKLANVWLSKENQMNYKAKHDAARDYPDLVTFPMKYKIAETDEKVDVYEEFQTIQELAQFYLGAIAYIETCVNEGWARKKAIDWAPYEALFTTPTNEQEAE